MVKNIIIAIILSLFVLVLTGCSSTDVTVPVDTVDNTVDTETTPSTDPTPDVEDTTEDTSEDEIIQGIEDAQDLEEDLDMGELDSFDSDLEDFQI